MVNRHRGEMTVEMNGQPETLCLTLGALAELEDRYEGKNILTLVDAFAKGGLGAGDVLNVLHAGLIGAGSKISIADLNAAKFEGGFAGAARTVATLLKISFGLGDSDGPTQTTREVGDEPDPFPGAD